MTDPKSKSAADSPVVVSSDTPVVDAPAVVTDPADSSDAWKDDSVGTTDQSAPLSDADVPADSTLAEAVHGDSKVDEPVVPTSVDGPVGYQTVGDQNAVVDNAALNAHAAEQASTTDQGFITRGGTVDASQGTPAGLDVTTPDNVHSDGGPTVFTDAEIDRLEALNLEAYEESVQQKLDDLENTERDLEGLRGRHADSADLSGDTSPQVDTSGDSTTTA